MNADSSLNDARQRYGELLTAEAKALAGSDVPPNLYHYTSGPAMRSIVSSEIVRAHNLGHLNDFSEGRYAASIMRAHIDRAYAAERDGNAVELFLQMRELLCQVDLSDVFAVSFTTDGDQSGMWGLYANRGRGFSFAISLYPAMKWLCEANNGVLLRCNYDQDYLNQLCVRVLSRAREIFLQDVTRGGASKVGEYAEMFLSDISWLAPAFKPKVWSDEREWRFIFRRPSVEHKVLADGETFLELPLMTPTPEIPRPIGAICAGPNCDHETEILPLQKVLYEKGYGVNFPVHTATAPWL